MREIKFRAWHKTEKKMYYVGGFHHILEADYTEPERQFEPGIQKVYLLEDEPRTCQKVWQYPADEIELMEYTGLKDAKGKEIYEGDIIKVAKNSRLFHVVLNEKAFCWDLVSLNTQGSSVSFTGLLHATFEVVGNIYENPELVKP